MTFQRKKVYLIIFLLGFNFVAVYSSAPTNFFKPFDINYRLNKWLPEGAKKAAPIKIGSSFEYGTSSHSYNQNSDKADLLSIYQDTQSSIAMLMGAKEGSDIYNLANTLNNASGGAVDDGISGHFKVDGRFTELNVNPFLQCNFEIDSLPGCFDLSCYVPIKEMTIKNVKWVDQTNDYDPTAPFVKQYLTSDFENRVKDLGDLDIGDWSKTGFGDIALMLGWHKNFPRYNNVLQNVRITGRIGLTVPTGAKKDEDKAFSLPLGNDGAFSMPVTLGLDLFYDWSFKLGIELQMLKVFDETKTRRLKTDVNQTDFLLLHKGRVRKDYGTAWKFNLYSGFEHFLGGLSGHVAYQYFRKEDDNLYLDNLDFSSEIVNSAQSLKDRTYHNFIFLLSYDFFKDCKNTPIKPQLMAFYKLPIAGRRTIVADTFGGELAFNF